MWASCRRIPDLQRAFPAAGFSLLELLVVLALISFMTALVAPNLKNTVDAVGRSGDRAEVQRLIEDLPLRARLQAQEIRLPAETDLSAMLHFPDGWSVAAVTPLVVRDSGVCEPARLRVRTGDVDEEWTVAMPDCRVGHAE